MMNEQISAWIDGELSEQEARRVHDAVIRQASMQAHCGTVWLIGDVMRDEAPLSSNFTERVMAILEAEPTVLAPVATSPARIIKAEPRWTRWAAAFAGVSVVVWVAFAGNSAQQQQAQPVMASAVKINPSALPTTSRNSQDDDRAYLMAHQAYGPGVQMAGVSGYVRPVLLDEPIASR